MRTLTRCCLVVGLLASCYIMGASNVLDTTGLFAQDPADGPSDETIDKIRDANNAVTSAVLALKNDGRYEAISEDPNAFAVLAGGVDAMADLQSGRGVDPVTFAALYAGRAVGEVEEKLSKDDKGRLLYNNKLVRMYSIGRLKRMYAERARILGEEEGN